MTEARKLDPLSVPVGSRIWRPVAVIRQQDGSYDYKVYDIKLGTGKRDSPLCRATKGYSLLLPGELAARNHDSRGLCVFIEAGPGGLFTDWTCLIVTHRLSGSVVAKPVPTARTTLLNVYPDPIRQKRIHTNYITMAGALPPHTGNFIFPEDRGFVSCDVEGTGQRNGQSFVHTKTAGFAATAGSVKTRELTISWESEGIKFEGVVPAESFDVMRGH